MLRQRDQVFLASVTCVTLVAVFIWWGHAGESQERPVEWHRAAANSARFVVDVNSADWPELTQLPEIGETLARRIVENRHSEGPFRSPEDLTRVPGIGEKTLNQMRPYLSRDSWSDRLEAGGETIE